MEWNFLGTQYFEDKSVASFEGTLKGYTIKKEIENIIIDGFFATTNFYYSIVGNNRVFNDFGELFNYLEEEL